MEFDTRGAIHKRGGLVVYTNYPSKAGVSVLQIFRFGRLDGTKELLVFFSDGTIKGVNAVESYTITLKKSDGTNYGNHSGTKQFGIYIFQDICYFGNSIDGWFKFPGKASGVYNATAVDTIPKCDYGLIRNNRAFYSGDPTAKDSVYFSQVADVANINLMMNNKIYGGDTTTGGGGQIRFPSSPDIEITGIASFQDALIVFKRNSAFALTGTIPESDFAVKQLNVATGCVSGLSIVNADNVLYYMGNDGLYRLQSPFQGQIESVPVSDKIKPEMDSMVDKTVVHTQFFKNKLYVFDPNAKTLVFDTLLQAWSKYDLKMTASMVDLKNDHLVMGNTTGYVYYIDPTKKRDQIDFSTNAPINGIFSTKYFNFSLPAITKRFRYALIAFRPDDVSTNTHQVTLEIDYKLSYKQLNVLYDSLTYGSDNWSTDPDANGGTHPVYWGSMKDEMTKVLRFSGTGKNIRLTFSNNVLDEELEIHGITFGFIKTAKVR
jgi:hypothetical protein